MNGVHEITYARRLAAGVLAWTARLGLRFGDIGVSIRLEDHLNPGCLGKTLRQQRFFGRKLVRNRIPGIAIARGLSPLEFQGVLAHELGHVWLTVHKLRLPLWAEEGFCSPLGCQIRRGIGGHRRIHEGAPSFDRALHNLGDGREDRRSRFRRHGLSLHP
jgi:hypothetical protein